MLKVFNGLSKQIKSQKVWEYIYRTALDGMNFGNGGNIQQSGELNVLRHIQGQLSNEPLLTIFDVGANVGNYSIAVSDFFKTKAKIHAFEPSKKTYEMLTASIKNDANIISNNFGFSDVENTQLLYTTGDGSGWASVYQRNLQHLGESMDKTEEIKLSTIDAYCSAVKIDRIHFLKLDIEGHELKALMGAKQMISSKKIDFIQFEFGGCNIDSRTYFQDYYYLLKDNYRIYRILKDGLHELKAYSEIYEIFMTINYLAVKR